MELKLSEEELKQKLGLERYHILREKGTELPGSSNLNYEKRTGVFSCGVCGTQLFESNTKYESGSGWPSFWEPVSDQNVELIEDKSHGMVRTEVNCKVCGSHLGHVFPDGPQPTGLRYCINGGALDFKPEESKDKSAE